MIPDRPSELITDEQIADRIAHEKRSTQFQFTGPHGELELKSAVKVVRRFLQLADGVVLRANSYPVIDFDEIRVGDTLRSSNLESSRTVTIEGEVDHFDTQRGIAYSSSGNVIATRQSGAIKLLHRTAQPAPDPYENPHIIVTQTLWGFESHEGVEYSWDFKSRYRAWNRPHLKPEDITGWKPAKIVEDA